MGAGAQGQATFIAKDQDALADRAGLHRVTLVNTGAFHQFALGAVAVGCANDALRRDQLGTRRYGVRESLLGHFGGFGLAVLAT